MDDRVADFINTIPNIHQDILPITQPVPSNDIVINFTKFRELWMKYPHTHNAFTKGSMASKFVKGTDARSFFLALTTTIEEAIKDCLPLTKGSSENIKALLLIYRTTNKLICDELLTGITADTKEEIYKNLCNILLASLNGFINTHISETHLKP